MIKNMSSQNSENNLSATQVITLPFPPIISAQDLIDRRSPERVTAKCPNAFFVYRKDFVNYLQINNYNFKMRDVSSMAGSSWRAASKEVKDAYKQIARDVERIIMSQRQKKFKEYTNNRNRMNNDAMIRPIYLELPSQFHQNSASYFPQQPPSMPVNTWFSASVANHSDQQHFQQNQETIYDTSSYYDSLPSQFYENNQYFTPMIHSSIVEDNQQQFDQQFDQQFNDYLVSQEFIQHNFTPINSAIDQFNTDSFDENEFILWPTQNNEEKQD
ncbi:hypothetical protein C1645_854091 [Glomus cerebriforme]|uniref:HMG box domain-containing protein n=1 Tax=Glomus cerebriforme TaxID=658196 RepID=A0A397TWM1_9GLOM|nr:hypothetical protein C1645_854091 [Glomus cerebriforme]